MFSILMCASRRPHSQRPIFGLFLILMGIERFLVEIVRAKDDRFLGPFTIAQLISVIIFICGALLVQEADPQITQMYADKKPDLICENLRHLRMSF